MKKWFLFWIQIFQDLRNVASRGLRRGLPVEGEHCRLLVPGFDMANHDPRHPERSRFPEVESNTWIHQFQRFNSVAWDEGFLHLSVSGWLVKDAPTPSWRNGVFVRPPWKMRNSAVKMLSIEICGNKPWIMTHAHTHTHNTIKYDENNGGIQWIKCEEI